MRKLSRDEEVTWCSYRKFTSGLGFKSKQNLCLKVLEQFDSLFLPQFMIQLLNLHKAGLGHLEN